MKKKLTLEKIIQRRNPALGITEIFSGSSLKKEITALDIIRYDRISPCASQRSVPHIAIIKPRLVRQLRQIEKKMIRPGVRQFFAADVFLVFCSGASGIPEFLKNFASDHNTAAAASVLDEYCLESRLTGLLREKFRDEVSFHGVVLEIQGRGILITGQSGIGKTTAALRTVQEGNCWVADDVVLVRKNQRGELIACGHDLIGNLIYTKKTGIVPAGRLIDGSKIKKNTKLAVMIEVEKNKISESRISEKSNEILETTLPGLHIRIPVSSYFDKNLLKKSLRLFFKDN
jgi:serine kinase of HPr protein (carbohydrate metabolism regulator)